MTDSSLDYVQNFQKQDAFDYYMQQNVSFYDYSEGYFNFNDNCEHIVLYFKDALNQNRIEMINNLVDNYQDPPVFYSFRLSQTISCPSEIIINDSDSTTFDTMSLCYINQNTNGYTLNKLTLKVIINSFDSGYESQYDPTIALQIRDVKSNTTIAFSGEVSASGPTTLTNGGALIDVIFDNLNFDPSQTAIWEIAGYVLGNVCAKISGAILDYYLAE